MIVIIPRTEKKSGLICIRIATITLWSLALEMFSKQEAEIRRIMVQDQSG
jgi:hypothetical protein